jgi:hypothetical protein
MPFHFLSVRCQRRLHVFALFDADVARVKPRFLFLSQQIRRLADIADIGCRRHQRVHQA